MRKLRVLLVVVPLLLVAADDKDIQGTWKAVAIESDGAKAPEEVVKQIAFVFKGDKVNLKNGDKEDEAGFKLDPDKKPKTIDIIVKAGDKTAVLKGIYVLNGDELKLCTGQVGKDRPTEFAAKVGSGTSLITFKREK